MRITTDSRPMDEPKDPDTDHLYQLYSLLVDDAAQEEMAALYRRGGFGYGDVKKAIAEAAEAFFAEPRARREELAAHPNQVARNPRRRRCQSAEESRRSPHARSKGLWGSWMNR